MPARPRDADPVSAKIVLLGESAVGKSSLALRFVKNEFHSHQETTIGAAYLFRTLTVPPAAAGGGGGNEGARAIKLEIWDTAGQERYRSLAPIYYRGAYGALVVYDVTNRESFLRAKAWVEELRSNADPHLVLFLVGNKRDLASLRQVPEADGRVLADDEGLAAFYETSAKESSASNVEAIFTDLAMRLLDSGIVHARATAASVRRPNAVAPAPLGEQPPTSNGGGGGGGCCGLS